MIYDLPITPGMATSVVSWRGNGSDGSPQYPTNVWVLGAGNHILLLYGREANVEVGQITIAAVGSQILTPPSVANQPQSQTVAVGQSASFSVSASGTAPLVYQWYFNGNLMTGAT